ncbi:DUF4365 domain-containing protein [Hyphomicrobium zavarzinii]|uniref:DUF4365 domain-containing protein n=1 Tax=Hyphomicrobium zavarzinii TaxID=48292 RepID=UPI00036EF067|nr:DUF4365 domain-containing protein [Hyphomicrobium zavarzinii]
MRTVLALSPFGGFFFGMARSTDSTSRTGVHAVGLIFSKKLGWIFREQHESDFGIDAQVEVKEGGRATGRLIALQIKSGPSHLRKRGENFVYRGEKRHLEYWLNHPLPVFLIFHDPEPDITLWQKIDVSFCEVTEKGWSIEVPKGNVLDERAAAVFKSKREPTEEETRREHLKFDLDVIEAVSKHDVKFEWRLDDDPEIGVTDLKASYRDKSGKEKIVCWESYGGGSYTVHDVMQERYWFLDWDYDEDVIRYDDCEDHILAVTVRPEVLGWLAVEKILREGPPEIEEREIPYEEPTFEESFREALELDWQAEMAERERDRDG